MGDTVCMLSPGTGCQINRSRRPHTAFSGYDINDASAGIASIDGTAGTFDHLDLFYISNARNQMQRHNRSIPAGAGLSAGRIRRLIIQPPPIQQHHDMSIPINRYLLAIRPAIILSPVISHIIDVNPRYTSDCIGNILKMLLFYLFPCNNLHISARPCVGLLCNNISKCIPRLVHVRLNNHFIQVVYSLRMDSAHRKCQYRRCSTNSFVHSDRLLFNHHSIYYNKNIIKFKFYII